jgi:hypothetical protein
MIYARGDDVSRGMRLRSRWGTLVQALQAAMTRASVGRADPGTMKTIATPSGAYLTSNEIADTITQYGLRLARERRLEVVDIPYVTGDGATGRVQLRVGWLAEMATITHPATLDDRFEGGITPFILWTSDNVHHHQNDVFHSQEMEHLGAGATNWEHII